MDSAEMEVMLSNPWTDLDGDDRRIARTRAKARNLLVALLRRKAIPFVALKDREAVAEADAPNVDCGYVRDFAMREIRHEQWMNDAPDTYRIFLTVDPVRQYAARKAVDSVIDDLERKQGSQLSIVDLDRSGRVLALQGGADYDDSQFDRASNSRRSPGSLAKIFVMAEACEQGKTLNSVVHDLPFPNGRPKNYDGKYKGDITLREAFAESRNAAFVRLAEEIGVAKIRDRARLFGIAGPFPGGGEIALGQFEATPLQMTAAVATIANGGRYVQPYAVAGISGSYGSVSHWRKTLAPETRAVSERCANVLDEAMRDVVIFGTGRRADIAFARGKTGTTNDYRDAWFVGYAQPAVVGVWVGNDDHRLTMSNVTGGDIPAHTFRNYLVAINTAPPRKRKQVPTVDSPKSIALVPTDFANN